MSQNAARFARPRNFHEADAAYDRTERRLNPRQSSSCMAHVRSQQSAGGTYQPATIWDVSVDGIGFFLDYTLEPGVLLDVQFRHLAVRDRVAEVRHATVREGGWLVGCKLKEPLSMIEARALGA